MSLISPLVDQEVLTAEMVPEIRRSELFEEEWRYVEKAVPKRQAEYCAGRICARGLIAELGLPKEPLLTNDDRSPRWPDGIVGSISHTDLYCVVAIARARSYVAIGIDVERDEPIAFKLFSKICTREELDWLQRSHESERGRLAKLIFCAKESVYKCQYTLTKRSVGFMDVEVDIDLSAGIFEAFIEKDLGTPLVSRPFRLRGRFIRNSSLVAAVTTIKRVSSSSYAE